MMNFLLFMLSYFAQPWRSFSFPEAVEHYRVPFGSHVTKNATGELLVTDNALSQNPLQKSPEGGSL